MDQAPVGRDVRVRLWRHRGRGVVGLEGTMTLELLVDLLLWSVVLTALVYVTWDEWRAS